jgi:hypothetical protein
MSFKPLFLIPVERLEIFPKNSYICLNTFVMALPQPQQTAQFFLPAILPLLFFCALITLSSCKHEKKVYTSNCNVDANFKRVSFRHLIDSIGNYDKQYVEVSGRYEEDKELSALVSDSILTDGPDSDALWVSFSQDCPLYQAGTHQGLFEFNDGQFTQINNKAVTIRGIINLHNKGHEKKYKATIERISLVKL